jgi:hypothetical protein
MIIAADLLGDALGSSDRARLRKLKPDRGKDARCREDVGVQARGRHSTARLSWLRSSA